MRALLTAALLTLCAGDALAQRREAPPPGPTPTRHGDWLSVRAVDRGRDTCVAATQVPRRGLMQVTVARGAEGGAALLLIIRIEGANMVTNRLVRFTTDGRTFELPGQVGPMGGPTILAGAGNEEGARTLSELLVAMRRGRELRIEAGDRASMTLPLNGASDALGAMRACAQAAGMMAR